MSQDEDAELKRRKLRTALILVIMVIAVYILTLIFKQQ